MPRRSLIDRIIIAVLGAIPVRILGQMLFLLKQERTTASATGFEIRSMGYYEPCPDLRVLTRSGYETPRQIDALDLNVKEQLELLKKIACDYGAELKLIADGHPPKFDFHNAYFSGLDAAIYYGLLRHLKPERVIEVGCGYSTQIAHLALEQNRKQGYNCDLIAIEPFPEERLFEKKLNIELIRDALQNIEMKLFDSLKQGDVLFIDSSHVAKYKSDVCRAVLEIFPRLQSGVWVHLHDIFTPYDYPEDWIFDTKLAFNEQYILEAFLCFNNSFRIRLANYFLSKAKLVDAHAEQLLIHSKGAPSASFWLERI